MCNTNKVFTTLTVPPTKEAKPMTSFKLFHNECWDEWEVHVYYGDTKQDHLTYFSSCKEDARYTMIAMTKEALK